MTLSQIATLVRGDLDGDGSALITGVAGIREAREGDITFLSNRKYASLLEGTRASAIIVSRDIGSVPLPAVRVENPDLAFTRVVERFTPHLVSLPRGVAPGAYVSPSAILGKNVTVLPHAVIQDEARIGDGTIIYSGVYIGHESTVGSRTVIYANVVIRERCRVGSNCIIHSGTVIGADGFGFTTVNGKHHKIPQIGTVEIEDDVEIGANVTIDRARFDCTRIRKGTKIDNLVQIAHNVEIGENSFIIAQTAIAGSTKVGNNVILAGQSGVDGHLEVGSNVVIASRAGVTKNVPSNVVVSGFPAQPHDRELRLQASLRRVPELLRIVKRLEQRVQKLERKAKNHRRKA